jgi:hypothetical protein
MQIMESYDYDSFGSLARCNPEFWLRTQGSGLYFIAYGEKKSLPRIKEDNLYACKEYAEINSNFAYKYEHSAHNIIVWDKTVEKFLKVSAPLFQEIDTCGMGLMSYKKGYPKELEDEIPTYEMFTAAQSILYEFFHFKRQH